MGAEGAKLASRLGGDMRSHSATKRFDGAGLRRCQIEASQAHSSVIIDIVDSGHGIDQPEELFEVGLTHKEGRVALRTGLFFVKHVVDSMGGHLSVDSLRGAGTRARISLPGHELIPREGEAR